MYARATILAVDPGELGTAIRYIERTVRPHLEAQDGLRGLGCMVNADLGLCVFASYWDSLGAMIRSERAVEASRTEVLRRLDGTVTVEHYEIPVFVRRRRAQDNAAGVRLNRYECPPARIDAAIEEFRRAVVPAILNTPAICSVQVAADRTTGRGMVATAWETMDAMAASRPAIARLRASATAVTHAQVHSVEEYRMIFSTVRDGIALEAGVWVTPQIGHDDGTGARREFSEMASYWVL